MIKQDWYSAVQLAKSGLLGYTSVDSIVALVDAGELKAKIRGNGRGRKIHIKLEWIEDYLNKK